MTTRLLPNVSATIDPTTISEAVRRATARIAPLWPLSNFVAVNPFLGLADQPFADAAETLARVAGANLTLPRAFYLDAIATGRISHRHLEAALATYRTHWPALPATADGLLAIATTSHDEPAMVPTVADVVGQVMGQNWSRFVTDRISFWAAGYFDAGQASWLSPWRDLPPYAAWRAEAAIDRTADVMGAAGARAAIGWLPSDAQAAITSAIAYLGVPEAGLETYLHRLLVTIGGWAAYARYRGWQADLYGGADDTVVQLLAIRLGWEVALLDAFAPHVRTAWQKAITSPPSAVDRAFDIVLQHAYELGWQEQFLAQVGSATTTVSSDRPAVQAAFCIDVRSEVIRRALETVNPAVETIGFAGFFGFPVEYIPLGMETGGAQCPVLLTPSVVIAETVGGAASTEVARIGAARRLARRAATAWKAFKQGAISCFSFVGPVGLAYAPKLVTDSLGRSRPVANPRADGLPASVARRIGPTIEIGNLAGRATGLTATERLTMAETVLRAMSLTATFARIVLIAGHGSTTVNNPHATGLDCGACGGHTGEANARVAALVLNDPAVRAGLRDRGIDVPDDTIFLAGLHDTTTDKVTIFDSVPATHQADLTRLRADLAAAARRARAERAPSLHVAPDAADAAILARSRDWSQVRPEWGLAGCAAFIAAPRHRTRGLNLAGRSFLHSYDWKQDRTFSTLDLILSAPVVVASWISLQYYGSTVDNRAFGSGNKVLHNVVGALGVLEGNGGDLRTGLPWQSVHDGTRYVHEPLRLNVIVEAPIAAMNDVIARHASVRLLVDNGWLHLWAMDDAGTISHRYSGDLGWETVASLAAA